MEALPLDSDGYSGTYKLIGGRLCLDFVNTLAWRGTEKEHDWFDQWINLVDWAVATGLLTEPIADGLKRRCRRSPAKAVAVTLDVIKGQRELLQGVLSPLLQGKKPNSKLFGEFNKLLRVASGSREIELASLQWTWRTAASLEDITAPIVLDAADLVATGDHTRLGSCPACGWIFYDSSRNRSRHWCDMADCGSRDKSLKYYHRQRRGT